MNSANKGNSKLAKYKSSYPILFDQLTNDFITNSQPYSNYWKLSEEYILNYALRIIKQGKHKTILDLGVGEGRLISYFVNIFKKYTALEPDVRRIRIAKNILKDHNNIKYINNNFLDYDPKNSKFDIVFCHHVIQHISTQEIGLFIRKIYKILNPGGTLILTFSHSKTKFSEYILVSKKGGFIKSRKVLRNKFNRTVEHSIRYSPIFPVHFIPDKKIKKMLNINKYKIIKVKYFHVLLPPNLLDKYILRDHLVNLFRLSSLAQDILIVART